MRGFLSFALLAFAFSVLLAETASLRFLNDEASLTETRTLLLEAGLDHEAVTEWMALASDSADAYRSIRQTDAWMESTDPAEFSERNLLAGSRKLDSKSVSFLLLRDYISVEREWPEWFDFAEDLLLLSEVVVLRVKDYSTFAALYSAELSGATQAFTGVGAERGVEFAFPDGVSVFRAFEERESGFKPAHAGIVISNQSGILLLSKWEVGGLFYRIEFDNWKEMETFSDEVFLEGEDGFSLIGEVTVRSLYD